MLFDATLTLLFVPAQQISPLSLVLFSFCCTRNPNFQIICTLSNGMLCYRSNNMCDFSTTKLNRELYLNRVTLPNNMYDFRGVVFCCTDCCREISLVQQRKANSSTSEDIFQSDSMHTASKRMGKKHTFQ